MGLNLDQALAELASLNNPTVDQLRDIVNRVDVGTPAGSTTLLYSGALAQFGAETVSARQIAFEFNKSNSSLAIIDKTAVGNFWSAQSFRVPCGMLLELTELMKSSTPSFLALTAAFGRMRRSALQRGRTAMLSH